MSTWISSRAALLAAVPALAGCLGLFDGDAGRERIAVADDAVTIVGPRGYCIDPEGTRDTGDAPVVLLGSCAALTQAESAPRPDRPAVLTATVMPAGAGLPSVADSLDALTELFGSEAGRAALSRSGRADSVEVRDIATREGVVILQLRDTSDFDGPRIAPDYWRALFDIGAHVVTLSVMAPEPGALTEAGGLATLEEFVRMVRAQNAVDADAN